MKIIKIAKKTKPVISKASKIKKVKKIAKKTKPVISKTSKIKKVNKTKQVKATKAQAGNTTTKDPSSYTDGPKVVHYDINWNVYFDKQSL